MVKEDVSGYSYSEEGTNLPIRMMALNSINTVGAQNETTDEHGPARPQTKRISPQSFMRAHPSA